MRSLVILAAVAALSGCANFTADLANAQATLTTASSSASQAQTDLAKLAVTDLQAALADAQAHQDAAAAQCYQALIPVVQAREGLPAISGGVSGFQATRDAVRLLEGNGAVSVACAALKASVKSDALSIGALFGI